MTRPRLQCRLAVWWLIIAGALLSAQSLQAAEVAGVQSGVVQSNGNGTVTVALGQAVNPATSVLFFHTRHNSNRPPGSMIRGRLAGATSVEFIRVSNETSRIQVRWSVVEFASGVRVQRGQVAQTANTLDVALAQPVASVPQAFVLYSKTPAATDSAWGSNDPIGGLLWNTSTVRFRTNSTGSHLIEYQVVEFTDPAAILVQSGETNIGGGASLARVVNLLQSVDPNTSFVLAGYRTSGGGADVGERMLQAELVDGNTARFSRPVGGDDIDPIVWQVIELRDGGRVLRGIEAFAAGQSARTVILPSMVDTTRAVAFSAMQASGGQNMGSTPYRGDDIPGVAGFVFDLSASSLDIARGSTVDRASVGWFVVEFNRTPAPVLDVAMNELGWNGTPGEVVDQVAANNGSAVNGAGTQSADPALPGNPGTCRYGDFDGSDDYLAFADAPHLDLTSELTVAIWVNTRAIPPSGLRTIVSKNTNYEFHLDSAGRIFWWWQDAGATVRSFTSSAAVNANQWHHVAITYTSGRQVIYVDGVAAGSAAFAGNLINNNVELQVGQDQGFPGRFWNGFLDELKVYDRALNAAQVQSVMNATRPCPASPLGDWHFDEFGWNGTPGEVVDYSGNGFDGRAFNTVSRLGLVCNAADLGADGVTDYLQLDATPFDGLTDFTLATWYRGAQTSAMAIVSGANAAQANELIYWFPAPNRFDPYLRGSAGTDILPAAVINDGNWHFLAWTRSAATNCLYVDGVPEGCETRPAGALSIAPQGLVIGQEQDAVGGSFQGTQDVEGDLDELLLFDQVLSAAELAAIRSNHLAGRNWDGTARACPVSGATGFVINHDGSGIHCLDEPVTVTAVDAGGAVVPGYASEITLEASTGRGSWSLLAGAGVLTDATADDGQATYLYDPADNGVASFALSYPEGPAVVNVDVYQSDDITLRDSDTEGPIAFAPSGFTVTASALPNPPPSPINDPIPAQTAGADFAVHLAAYGVTEDHPQCGVIENYDLDHDLTFSMSYLDPGSGTRVATVDGQDVNTGLTQIVAFAGGQAAVTVRYKDVGTIRLDMQDATSFSNILNGASNPFVVRPAALAVTRIQSAAGVDNPGATTMTGPAFVPAGEAFEVDVEAWDAEGDRTPNFGQEAAAESVRVFSAFLALPAGGRNGSTGDVANGSAFVPASVAGRFSNDTLVFDEVGVIVLEPGLGDSDYQGTGAVPGMQSAEVGRFYPAAFDLLTDAVSAGCGTFTYMEQPALSLALRLQALNVAGGVTQNYDAGLLPPGAVATLAYTAEAGDDGVDRGGRLSPVGGSWVAGEVTVNRNDLVWYRQPAPDGPFDPLQLALMVSDPLDAVALAGLNANALTSGSCIVAGDCAARMLGAATRVVYGRLMVVPTYGPENEDLTVPLRAQMFAAGAFEPNPDDSCSAYDAPLASLSGYTGNLSGGDTSVIGPGAPAMLLAGVADPANPLLLAAPDFGNDGSVDVTLNVAPWLEFDWQGSGLEDPKATVSFGRFRGHDRIIYWSEQR